MKTVKALIKRYPLLSYFALVFVISWGGMLLVIAVGGSGGVPMLAWVAGPPVSGILLTGLLHGRAGFRELLTRMRRWRVGARWYAVALLTAPLVFTVILLAFSLSSPEFLPRILTTSDKASVLLFGVAAGLMTGFFEELGWTGFAIPRMGLRYGVFTTGLIVGSVALPCELVGKRHFLRSALPGHLPARGPLLLHASHQGSHGVGLRSYWKPASCDAHAREFHSVLADLHASGDIRVAPRDLVPRMGRRAVGGCWGGRRGPKRSSHATAAPEAGGLRKE